MDTAKALDLRAANDLAVWDLEYDGPDLTPGRPVVAVPTTAGTGAETNSFAVITDEAAGRKGYIGHPSLLPVATILDPALTVGLPPAATAATGIDAMTHSLESLLSANPNPFAEAMALGVIRTIGAWLRTAVADGSDLEARSQMLLASHLAGVGQASGTGVGLVHALGHSIGTRGQAAARDRAGRRAARGPSLLPRRARPRAGARRDRARRGVRCRGSRRPAAAVADRRHRPAAARRRPATDACVRWASDEAAPGSLVAEDALDDAAIRNSPRLPTRGEARAILAVGPRLTVDVRLRRGRLLAGQQRDDLADEPLERLDVVGRRLLADHGPEAELDIRSQAVGDLLGGAVPERVVVLDVRRAGSGCGPWRPSRRGPPRPRCRGSWP